MDQLMSVREPADLLSYSPAALQPVKVGRVTRLRAANAEQIIQWGPPSSAWSQAERSAAKVWRT
jgi:hypothetical protein